jgi:DNA helicase-2/ATP-dependent DNA helicase PcrA
VYCDNNKIDHHTLNPSQRQAVEHGSGALLIYAGAGSGKTRVLTHKIARLIKEQKAKPDEILAVTFTNKAAKEMKERINSYLGHNLAPEFVSTFHSACARILRRHAQLLDFTRDFSIYDRSESMSALKRCYKKLNVDPKLIEPKALMAKIDRAKNNYQFSDHFRESADSSSFYSEEANLMADLYDAYQQELQSSNALDFGDLLSHVVTLFKLEKSVLEYYQKRFSHILVDEYQDTNRIQYMLIRMLAAIHGNLCVVGDDDQSVYSFRGANIENISSFKRDFPDHDIIVLNINYRSSKSILAAANAVIENNRSRHKKELTTDNQDGRPVVRYEAEDETSEAEFVVRQIKDLASRQVPLSEVAIFYRTNAQSRALEESFYAAGIPHVIYGGQRFYDRKEIKDILAYCRLALNNKDNEAFIRIINSPTRGLGKTSLDKIRMHAEANDLSYFAAALETPSGLSARATKSLSEFTNLVLEISKHAPKEQASSDGELTAADTLSKDNFSNDVEYSLQELLQFVAKESGYLEQLEKADSEESQSRIENIFELYSVADDFSRRSAEEGQHPLLSAFLERTSLNSNLDESDESTSVSLMTLHLAKGLEFDAVFLVGLEEGLLPHARSLDELSALEEERRLCYVGITRARKELFLSYANTRRSAGMGYWGSGGVSRFLLEIPEELLEVRY